MRIFISIAAYRDPELVPTIEDGLARAADPQRLRFGICWQRGDDEAPLPWRDDPRFRIVEVPWQNSEGACWARATAMRLFADEEYYLQLDSHHRFVDGWDEKLIAQLAQTGRAQAILSSYPPPYEPDKPGTLGDEPYQIVFERFGPEGLPVVKPAPIPGWRERRAPMPARFLAAGFLFTTGGFVRDVPYDPELYFLGEEITMTVRAFTAGYDLFHPVEAIVWHEYVRDYRPHKHWSDHVAERVAVPWFERDRRSLEKVRAFLVAPEVKRDRLGTVRRFADYEAYAGLDFARRCAQDYTRAWREAPNPSCDPGWAEQLRRYDVDIRIDRELLGSADDWAFWFVGFHDDSGAEIFRRDADRVEIDRLLCEGNGAIRLSRSFECQRTPARWIVWPHSHGGEWLDRLEGEVAIQMA